jgi:peroxiredoxin
MNLIVFGIALPWLFVAFGGWLGYQLLRQNGRILMHLEALEPRLAALGMAPAAAPAAPETPAGLPFGSPAPEFELRDLAGGRRALSHFRGQRVLLIFFNPGCGFCTQMAPDLAALPTDGENGQTVPVVVTTGDAGENRRLIQEHGIRCPVLLQEQMEVASQYLAQGTPMGYLIDEEGSIASEVAAGAPALLALVNAAPTGSQGQEAHSPAQYESLPLGTTAPEFTLPRLGGGESSLAEYRGRRVLLIFFNPQCGFCTQMAPDLAALPTDGENGRPVPLVVTTGDARENRNLVQEHGIHGPVLLQKGMEVASQYKANGTPMGYLIDEEGNIASEIAVGAPALLELASAVPADWGAPDAARNGKGHREYKGNRSLVESHIQRGGLAAGTPAPDFTLPRLDWGELSLAEYRGRQVLLVFSDPHCGPCNHLAPQLEELHRRVPAVQVLMVSRRGIEANRAKVAEHGLTFPVLLQRQWEISRLYAKFETPVGYLIDEDGIIAAEVAVGADAIQALLARAEAGELPSLRRRCRCGKPLGEYHGALKNGRAPAAKAPARPARRP